MHLVVLCIAIAFLLLGRWQLARLDERQAANEQITQRMDDEETEWRAGSFGKPPEYVRLEMTGEFRAAEEVLLRSQVNLGRPGFDVLTPFYLDETTAVVVNRGWVPFDLDQPPVGEAAPPVGVVTVRGYVRHPLARAGATSGVQDGIVSSVDLAAIGLLTDATLEGFYIELTEVDESLSALPIIDNSVDLSSGPHLAYAVQWFAFTTVGVVGYAALIRSTARKRRSLNRREEPRQPDPS
jgi:cytochrome oxidase assembly protein ShyY1